MLSARTIEPTVFPNSAFLMCGVVNFVRSSAPRSCGLFYSHWLRFLSYPCSRVRNRPVISSILRSFTSRIVETAWWMANFHKTPYGRLFEYCYTVLTETHLPARLRRSRPSPPSSRICKDEGSITTFFCPLPVPFLLPHRLGVGQGQNIVGRHPFPFVLLVNSKLLCILPKRSCHCSHE